MGETTVNKLPFPEDKDVPNGPAQIKALAELLDTLKWGSRNLAPLSGLAKMTSDKTNPAETYEDVGGASATFTLATKSFVIVYAVWEMEAFPLAEPTGTMRFDAVDNAATAVLRSKGEAAIDGNRATVAQVYREELAAGEHTLKMRIKKVGVTSSKLYAAGTRFTYFAHSA